MHTRATTHHAPRRANHHQRPSPHPAATRTNTVAVTTRSKSPPRKPAPKRLRSPRRALSPRASTIAAKPPPPPPLQTKTVDDGEPVIMFPPPVVDSRLTTASLKSHAVTAVVPASVLAPVPTKSRVPSRRLPRFDKIKHLTASLQTLHLVIDLDSTFVKSWIDMKHFQRAMQCAEAIEDPFARADVMKRIHAFACQGDKFWCILRPGSVEFIEFASIYFRRISVWSAGGREYVDSVVSFLFPAHVPRPSVVFDWKDCRRVADDTIPAAESAAVRTTTTPTTAGVAASPSNAATTTDVRFLKPIQDLAVLVGDDISKMLILDDRSDIATANRANLIHIPAFEPKITTKSLETCDTCLDELASWLLTPAVLTANDIRAVPKDQIFSRSAE